MPPRASTAQRTRRLASIGVALGASGCLAAPVTDRGRGVAWLYDVFGLVAIGVFVLVAGLLAWTVVRHRGRPGRAEGLVSATAGHLGLEVAWWATPTVIVFVLAVLTAFVLADVDARSDEPAVTVEVDGFQWGWRFTYAGTDVVVAGTTADPPRIALPVDEPIAFEITSEDVIHSFNLPAFLIKRDAVPSHENRFDVVIEEEGTYAGQCGEFCGLLHSYQTFEIDAMGRDAFDAWLADQAP